MNANDVIRIGRSRSWHASSVASKRGSPSSCCCLANSTIRIAFLLARPTSTTKPICVKMLMSMLRQPARRRSSRAGTSARPGSRQRQRPALVLGRQHQEDEHHRQREDDTWPVLPAWSCMVGQLGPLVAPSTGGSSCLAELLHDASIAWPELMPGRGVAVDRGRRVHVVAVDDRPGPLIVADVDQRAQRHHLALARCGP